MEGRLWLPLNIGSIQVPALVRARTPEETIEGEIGLFDRLRLRIWIWEDLPIDAAKQALFHEMVHATQFIFGIPTDPEDDEHVSCLVSAHGYDVLARNGLLCIPDPPLRLAV